MTLTPEIYFEKVPPTIDMNVRSELYSNNEFTFAVAVILSAQATDKKVNEVTPALFAVADTPEKMLKLGIDGLKEHIKVISFFNNKAKSIMGLAAALFSPSCSPTACVPRPRGPDRGSVGEADEGDKNQSSPHRPSGGAPLIEGGTWKFPMKYHDRDALMKLPGIGQKTANVIMNVLWGAPYIGVDTHVFRNAHRYGWVNENDFVIPGERKRGKGTPEKVEEKLLKIIPEKYHGIVNHVMVLHGRYTCKALRPDCANCPVAKWCEYKLKTES